MVICSYKSYFDEIIFNSEKVVRPQPDWLDWLLRPWCVYMPVILCTCIYVCFCVCVYLLFVAIVHVYVRMCVCVHVHACERACVLCIYVYACACVYVHADVCEAIELISHYLSPQGCLQYINKVIKL